MVIVSWCCRSAIFPRLAARTPCSQTARASVPAKTRTKIASSRRIRRLACFSFISSAYLARFTYPYVDWSDEVRPSSFAARVWICEDASSRERFDCNAAFSARSFVRSEFVESRERLSLSTATFTNTTPASRIPLAAIQRIPPRARACARLRVLVFVFGFVRGRGRTTGSAIVDWACERLANLRPYSQPRGLCARVAGNFGGTWTDGATRRRAHRRLGATDADREIGRARAALLLLAEELLDEAVLERVERDHRQAPARAQHLECGRERTLDRAELVVHLDA